PLASERWLRAHDVRLVATRALALDPAARTVALADGRELGYAGGHCLLATGAEPARLPLQGADDPRVRVLRTLAQLRLLVQRLRPEAPVAVIGSGFIGCEAAVSLRRRGHPVTLLSAEPAPQAARLGEEVAARLSTWLALEGVELRAGAEIDAIEHEAGAPDDAPSPAPGAAVVRAGDAAVRAELVVMAVGVRPRIELARAAGIALADDGGAIATDAAMRTGHAGVLAAGDAARAQHALAGRPLRVEHWGDALTQGAVAGRTAAGAQARWDEVPGFWSTIGERTLKHAAWGDGHARVRVEDHPGGGFTAWYGDEDGRLVGVLAHDADDDYERGRTLIAQGASAP
ncbi:MAG TPA: FAD-dependent oxidoreductase, partial [Conexibacter sp.]|nr:FAD-dependent oxidoreductase [Conexibacter sp.]